MDINFELYKIFYMVTKVGSFTAAAKELFITQSAVSQSIKILEENLGCQLFIRGPRSIKLTGAGELLFRHVEQAYSLFKAAEGKLLEMRSLSFGEIKIGVSDTILRYFVTPSIQKFIRDYPGIKISIINRTSPGILDSIKKGSVDLGIVTLPVNDREIETIDFIEVEDVFAASSRFSYLQNRSLEISELASLPLLLLEKKSSTRHNLDEFFASKGIDIKPEIELESIELLVEFARIGLGISHVLKESVSDLIEKKELFIVETVDRFPPRKLGIARLHNVPLSPAASEFTAYLKHNTR